MKSRYFQIEELVSKAVFIKYGETSWQFFDPRLIETIDWIKENLNRTIVINNWLWGRHLEQRGLRENTSNIVVSKTEHGVIYLSGHVLGMAVDFDVTGITAQEVREWLYYNRYLLPHPIRLEKNVSWVHLGVDNISNEIIEYF